MALGGLLTIYDKYPYEPLSADGSEIRLLGISRSTEQLQQRFNCSMHTFKLKGCPPYVALSYTWGGPDEKTDLHVIGRLGSPAFTFRLCVPISLVSALEHFSRKFQESILLIWADAACINQADPVERSQQVQRMQDIFKAASKVWAWIGESGNNSDLGFDSLRLWHMTATKLMKHPELQPKTLFGSSKRAHLIKLIDDSPTLWEEQRLTAIRRIIQRSWWSRLWTLQEIVLAHDAYLICGDQWFRWSDLWSVYDLWRNNYTIAQSKRGLHGIISLSHFITESLQMKLELSQENGNLTKPNKDLLRLLEDTAFFDTTDPRDKIYAVMGLAKEPSSTVIDYSGPVYQVFHSFAVSTVQARGDLRILQSAGLYDDTAVHKLPSWVPDWTVQRFRPAPLRIDFFCASGSLRPNYLFKDNSNVLRVSGIHVDHVQTLGTVFDVTSQSHKSLLEEWLRLLLPLPKDEIRARNALYAFWDLMNTESLPPFHTLILFHHCLFATVLAEQHESVLIDHMKRAEAGMSASQIFDAVLGELNTDAGTGLYGTLHSIESVAQWIRRLVWQCQYRRLFITSSGWIDLGPTALKQGDVLCVISGSKTPSILRQAGDHWLFIGESRVHGLMRGEAVESATEEDFVYFDLH